MHLKSLAAWIMVMPLLAASADAAAHRLANGKVTAEFDDGGLVRLSAAGVGDALDFVGDACTVRIDGKALDVSGLAASGVRAEPESVTYAYDAGNMKLEVVYQLKPGWGFLSKQLRVTLPEGAVARVEEVVPFRAGLKTPVAKEIMGSRATGAVFLRLGSGNSSAFIAQQNPFLVWKHEGGKLQAGYEPAMEWRAAYGAYESDRVCIGLAARTGVEYPLRNLGEWKHVEDPARALDGLPMLDLAEFDAMRDCVAAFNLFRPEKSVRVHVPWCENDYQIDVGTEAGRAEWKHIIDQCAATGVEHTLFTPANSVVAPLSGNVDAWGWENCLWLGLGQKIRKGEWDIAKDPIPASIQEMMDYAAARKVKLIAYVYPTLGWKQNPEWTAWCGGKTGGYVGVDTGVRSFQDWLVEQLVAFQKRTGVSGFSFDHWWIAYEPTKEGANPTSKYAQWDGCRRILEELQRRMPGIILDGRQQYQWYGPWTWLGGTYPHPTTHDEQPGSFENFPDLHFSRVSANRQRWATWYFHMEHFTPWELVPGYMTHQTPRNDANGQCVRDKPFHVRDWDYLGWKYSVVSSIGSAPYNHVVNLLPARDEVERRHFTDADKQWLKGWMDWTDANRKLLGKLRPVVGPPVLGRIDGMAAGEGDRAVVFLFNPNYRELTARFDLGDGIGLESGEGFLLRELYPQAGRWIGKPGAGVWQRGDVVELAIKGPEAMVVEVVPQQSVQRPVLLGVQGRAEVDGSKLVLAGVRGQSGVETQAGVLLPDGTAVREVAINGRAPRQLAGGKGFLTIPLRFAGESIAHCQQVGDCPPRFSGQAFKADLKVTRGMLGQLEQRRQAWPVEHTAEELLATWRGVDRLLMFIQIADPDDRMEVGLKIGGQAVEVRKAYSDVFPLGRERTFTGFYADVTGLAPDQAHAVEVSLPAGLKPGQFQGLFLENLETAFTSELAD